MAVLFMDSFDHYTTAADKGWTVVGGGITSVIARTGGQAVRVSRRILAYNQYVQRPLPSSPATVIVGVAMYADFTGSVVGTEPIIQLLDSGTVQTELELNSDGSLSAGGQTSDPGVFTYQAWNYIEFKATIDNAAGAVEVRVNGVQELSVSGIDTQNSGTAQVTQVRLASATTGSSTYMYFDDLVILDTTGTENNDLIGDVKVQALYPDGNGANSDFTGSDGNSVDNYQLVDENPPDTADYVQSGVAGHKDTYSFGDIGASDTPRAVQVNLHALKTDAISRIIRALARPTTTDNESADLALSTSAQILTAVFNTNPDSSTAWTKSAVDGAEFGVKVQS